MSHTACVAVPNVCSPLKILALKRRGRRRERLPPSSSNTCTRTGTIDQASEQGRERGGDPQPTFSPILNPFCVRRPRRRKRVVRKEGGGEIPLKADGEPLPMNGRKEELVNGFSRQCSSDQILHYAIQVYPGKKDGMKWWWPFQNVETAHLRRSLPCLTPSSLSKSTPA